MVCSLMPHLVLVVNIHLRCEQLFMNRDVIGKKWLTFEERVVDKIRDNQVDG